MQSQMAAPRATSLDTSRLAPVMAACALLITGASAYAQTAAPQPATAASSAKDKKAEPQKLETVKISGIRKGIEAAINVKKGSDNIVESVSAEDIGKLPDVSIAESIARLPGISAQRVAGRAQVLAVRGLSPDFSTSLLNGRELVSTGDNRSVEFDQYPSELMAGVNIYKTPDAALVGQGLAGTMNMITVRPLNFAERVISTNLRLSRNALGSAANQSGNGNRVSLSYIDQFENRTWGVALGFAHQDNPIQENQVGLYEPWAVNSRPGVQAGSFVSDGIKALRRTGKSTRDGLMATLEFRPSSEFRSTVDLFHSKAKQEDTANQFEVNLQYNGAWPCNPSCIWSASNTNANGTQTGGTITNVYPLVRGMYNKRDDDITAFGWNNQFTWNGVKFDADVNYSRAKRNEVNLENNTQLVPAPTYDSVKFDFRSNGFSQMNTLLSYADPSKLFLRNSIYGSGYGKTPRVEDELKGVKFTANIPLEGNPWFSDLDVGINYADRSKDKHQPEGNINVGAQGDVAIAGDLQYSPVSLGFAGLGMIPSWNVPAAVARYMTFAPSEDKDYLVAKAWRVQEKTTTAFARGNIDTQTWGVPLRGNVGVQVISVDQSSASQYWDGTAGKARPVTDSKTTTDVLPSLNLAWSLADDQTLRLAVAKQIARPRMDQLRSSLEFGVDNATGKPGGGGGNTQLDPWRANALDISWEQYFGTKGYVAAAFFHKDLKSYIYTQSRTYDFSKFTAGLPPLTSGMPILTQGQYTAPYNGQGGKLNGLELSTSIPLSLLAKELNGFGVQASASFTNSSIKIKDPDSASSVGGDPISLPGLSKSVINLTAYYEMDGFEARVSQRRRSDFIGEIGNFNGNRTLRYVVGENIIDMQLGYTFKEGSAKGMNVFFQVNNLNDAAYRTYAGTKDRPLEYIKWGRSFLLGASYKM